MSDKFKELLENSSRIAAVELLLTNLMATLWLQESDPLATVKAQRELYLDSFARTPIPGFEDAPGLSALVTGEVGDRVDQLFARIGYVVHKELLKRPTAPHR